MYFRNLILSAFCIALVAGSFLTLYQALWITPIILDAEIYEVAEPIANTIEAWTPQDGMERSGYSFMANLLVCFAYALLLMSAMATRTKITMAQGVFWGGAAYLSLFVMPALGLPPEIPGMEAAHLENRQMWWLLTVILTALGLWSLAFKPLVFKIVGVLMLILPHIMGAPQPETHGFANTAPDAITALTALWHHFIIQTSLANALLWLIIGLLSALLTKQFIYSLDHSESSHVS